AFLAAADRRAGPFVRAAFFAAADRWLAGRRRALARACFASAPCDAALCPSRLSTLRTARDRFADTFRRGFRPLARSRAACRRVRLAVPFFVPTFTPARRAFDSPIAMACFVERAPCFPSR